MEKVFVKVKTGKKEEKVEVLNENTLKVSVKELPREGRANNAVIKVLSNHFSIPKRDIELIKGFKGKNKVFLIKI